MRRQRWGAVCTQCLHAGAVHRLARDADSINGPYRCRVRGCRCAIPQTGVLLDLNRPEFLALFPTWPAPLHAMLDEGDPVAVNMNPEMHPGLTVRVDDGRAYLVILTDDAATEIEVTRDQLSALAGEAVRKAMILSLGG